MLVVIFFPKCFSDSELVCYIILFSCITLFLAKILVTQKGTAPNGLSVTMSIFLLTNDYLYLLFCYPSPLPLSYNLGIGKFIALDFARRGARVIMACRSEARGNAAMREIRELSGNTDVHLRLVDVSSLQSVREFAATILEEEKEIHILVNNAGASGTTSAIKQCNQRHPTSSRPRLKHVTNALHAQLAVIHHTHPLNLTLI